MARGLTFLIQGISYSAAPEKIDRKKLYGRQETQAIARDDSVCSLVSMDESSGLILPKGGIGMGNLSSMGEWVERSTLKTVALDGSELGLHKSSYDGSITIEQAVTPEVFLNHTIKTIYKLPVPPECIAAVGKSIYTFPYNYRDSYEQETAFLLVSNNTLFMLTGYEASFAMLTLEQNAMLGDMETEDIDEESDSEIDFSFR
ncbi:hypothetical protein TREPR_1849 [Treponema primitia ZAS-2]|uniref:Uncharacterized protein n=1 Tax=Treponema primitia (strain ATCC BAA-887 / DSM 12427 / ZAS-2) TaxID=545694 RepID=F5YL77_TREPZ|nr:hypothetical protein [Treponema primitia]AEF84557.1 hypothetical protein TREPR_1849 [Treponema primitia ZAS-2]